MANDTDQYLDSVKAWLSIVMILFVVYVAMNIFRFIKTTYLTQKAEVFPIIPATTKTIEIDLMPTMFIM